jgi:hypothetical protein
MTSDEKKEIDRSVKRIKIGAVVIWVLQLIVIALRLFQVVDWHWLWVFSISWVSILFWGLIVGGILLFDRIGMPQESSGFYEKRN